MNRKPLSRCGTLHLIDPDHLSAAHDLIGDRIGNSGPECGLDDVLMIKRNDPGAGDTPPLRSLRDGVA